MGCVRCRPGAGVARWRASQSCTMMIVHSEYCQFSRPSRMGIPPRPDHPGIEQSFAVSADFRQEVFRPVSQGAAQPMIDWHAKAHFRPIDQAIGDEAAQHLAQDPLTLAVTKSHPRREPPGKLDHPMINDWHPRFERYCHTGAVHFGQNVVRQIGHGVEILHALDVIGHETSGLVRRNDSRGLGSAVHNVARLVKLREELEIGCILVLQHDVGELVQLLAEIGVAPPGGNNTMCPIPRRGR